MIGIDWGHLVIDKSQQNYFPISSTLWYYNFLIVCHILRNYCQLQLIFVFIIRESNFKLIIHFDGLGQYNEIMFHAKLFYINNEYLFDHIYYSYIFSYFWKLCYQRRHWINIDYKWFGIIWLRRYLFGFFFLSGRILFWKLFKLFDDSKRWNFFKLLLLRF